MMLLIWKVPKFDEADSGPKSKMPKERNPD